MMLLTLLFTAWPVVVIAIIEIAIVFLIIKGIKYVKKKSAEKNTD